MRGWCHVPGLRSVHPVPDLPQACLVQSRRGGSRLRPRRRFGRFHRGRGLDVRARPTQNVRVGAAVLAGETRWRASRIRLSRRANNQEGSSDYRREEHHSAHAGVYRRVRSPSDTPVGCSSPLPTSLAASGSCRSRATAPSTPRRVASGSLAGWRARLLLPRLPAKPSSKSGGRPSWLSARKRPRAGTTERATRPS
jgi:hypothetical protein